MKDFDYDKLPFQEIARQYENGASWRELARLYGCPDHKTLKDHTTRRFPDMDVRDHAASQRARREREGSARRKTTKTKATKRPSWWR